MKKEYLIRKSVIEDKDAVCDAHRRFIREVCSKDYAPDQIKNWSAVVYDDDIWRNTVTNEYHIVIEKMELLRVFVMA